MSKPAPYKIIILRQTGYEVLACADEGQAANVIAPVRHLPAGVCAVFVYALDDNGWYNLEQKYVNT